MGLLNANKVASPAAGSPPGKHPALRELRSKGTISKEETIERKRGRKPTDMYVGRGSPKGATRTRNRRDAQDTQDTRGRQTRNQGFATIVSTLPRSPNRCINATCKEGNVSACGSDNACASRISQSACDPLYPPPCPSTIDSPSYQAPS